MAAGEACPRAVAEVVEHVAPARGAHRQALRRRDRPAARLGPLRRGGLDAGDDGHDPQPRARTTWRSRGSRRATGNPRFAWDSYRRLIQMYGEVVDGIDAHVFEGELQALKEERGVRQDVELDRRRPARRWSRRSRRSTSARPASAFPPDAREQLRRAPSARSSTRGRSPRARVYRRTYDIPDDLGTAVNVVQMVFGNKGDTSGTGVCFTRDPSTGERTPVRRVPRQCAGRGRRRRHPHARADRGDARAAARRVRRSLTATLDRLEEHYRDDAGHRVHGRGGEALPAPDARGQADGAGGAPDRGRHGRRGADHARGGGRADRPGTARPAAAPDDRSRRRASRSSPRA